MKYLHNAYVWDRVLLVHMFHFSCLGHRCSICNSCMCGTEFSLVHMFHVWNRGAVFAAFPYVGQSFNGAYVSCVGQRGAVFASFPNWDRVLLVHMCHVWSRGAVFASVACVG